MKKLLIKVVRVIRMERFLEKVDGEIQQEMGKIQKKIQGNKQNKMSLLRSLIFRTQEKSIILEIKDSRGRKEEIKITQRGIYLANSGLVQWHEIVKVNKESKEEMKQIVNNPETILSNVLQKALEGEVKIKVLPYYFWDWC